MQPGLESLSLINQVCIFEEGGMYCNLEEYILSGSKISTNQGFTRKQNS